MKYKYLLFMPPALIGLPALAQGAGQPGDALAIDHAPEQQITVLASGSRENLANTGQSITVFTREEMNAVQGADLTRLIERVPGVSVTRNGGPGSFTGVRVRGAEGEQLLVLVDGVKLADAASPGGGFDFGNLLMGNLAKIELQRSSNSTIWGSQALGGVLAATTRSEPGMSASVEYGAHDSFYGAAGLTVDAGPGAFGMQAGRYVGDGFSAAAGGTEPDGFSQTEFAGHASVALGGGLSAFARGRYADGRLEIDGFPAPAFTLADTAEYQTTRQRSGAAGLRFGGHRIELAATASLADTERDSFDPGFGPAPNYATDGSSERAELRGRWDVARNLALDFGGEREWLRFSTLFDPLHRTAIAGGYAQLEYDSGTAHLAAGLRRDAHRDFGGEWSFGADAALEFDPVRLTASYGEGFKAPTLFQLLSDFGNPALRPETSRSYDIGLGSHIGPLTARLTAFRRDTRGQIGFVSCFATTEGICAARPFGTYDNIGRARAQGLEAEASLRVGDALSLGAAYTLLDAEDRTAGSAARGNDLARRPKHALTGTVDWTPAEAVRLGADLRVVSHSFDDAANLVPLESYAVLTLRGEWDAAEHVTLFGRVENLGDESYQTAAGYATPGRGAYVGARVKL